MREKISLSLLRISEKTLNFTNGESCNFERMPFSALNAIVGAGLDIASEGLTRLMYPADVIVDNCPTRIVQAHARINLPQWKL